jgi:hypothetical protein
LTTAHVGDSTSSGRMLQTQVRIAAPASRVWQVLIDFPRYPEWNPFITEIEGVTEESARLRVRIQSPGRKPMTFKPTVIVVTRDRELRWLGHLYLPGLFDGEHSFRIEDKRRNCRFHQSERFSGVLVRLFGAGVFEATERGFEAMNSALKVRVEAG